MPGTEKGILHHCFIESEPPYEVKRSFLPHCTNHEMRVEDRSSDCTNVTKQMFSLLKKWAEALWCILTITSFTLIILWEDWWVFLLPKIITRAAVIWGRDWISYFTGWKIVLGVAQEASWTCQPENLSSSPSGVFMRHKLLTVRWLGSKKQKVKGVRVLASCAAASFLSHSISQS